jgi:hypothetical protein
VSQAVAVRDRVLWIHSAGRDLSLACAWMPFALVAWRLQGDAGALQSWMAAVFLLSFSHQPLTMALVYGDRSQFDLARRIFTWSPLVFAGAVLLAWNVSFVTLAIVGGLWNAEHTLMQRYGIVRIYGRKAGEDDGRLERALLFSLLALALVWVGADTATPARADLLGLGGANRAGVGVLTDLRPLATALLLPTGVVAGGLLVSWVRRERSRGAAANPAKHLYLGSTLLLFAVILLNPIAGFVGYVGAHAVEYFVIVHQALGRRYVELADPSPLGRVVRARPGRLGFLVVYLGLIVGIVSLLERYGSALAYALVFFTLGGLHVFYDGFIWKLRQPAVSQSLIAS